MAIKKDQGDGMRPSADLSVVIPTLNAASSLGATLEALTAGRGPCRIREVIVVDGGSVDESRQIARSYGARVAQTTVGRGQQLKLGGAMAKSPWVLFLHADSVLEPKWCEALAAFCHQTNGEQAAVFSLSLDDSSCAARILERAVAMRTRLLGLPYGDQGLLISKSLYDQVGGYAAIPLMEDVEMVRRLGRRRIQMLEHPIKTSAERYRRDGYARRVAKNLSILTLYYLGVSPVRLARLYG